MSLAGMSSVTDTDTQTVSVANSEHKPHMRYLVINLKRSSERRLAMKNQFQVINVEPEWLTATDQRTLSDEDWAQVDLASRQNEGRRPISNGAIACAISHRRAWKRVAESNSDELTVVLEDDAKITGLFCPAVQELTRVKQLFDVVFLHRQREDKPFTLLHQLANGYGLGLVRYSDHGTVAYAITPRSARRLLMEFPKIVHQIDHSMHAHWEHNLKVLSLDPPVVTHGNDAGPRSDLREGNKKSRKPNLPNFLSRLRSLCLEELRKRIVYRRKLRQTRSDFRPN